MDFRFFTHENINSLGVLFAIIIAIVGSLSSNRGFLLTLRYDVEDEPRLENGRSMAKRLAFNIDLTNVGDGPLLVQEVRIADSFFSETRPLSSLSLEDQFAALHEYENCSYYADVGTLNELPNNGLIVSGESVNYSGDNIIIEDMESTPICLKVSVTDHFGITHNMIKRVGEYSTSEKYFINGVAFMSHDITLQRFVYVLPPEKCVSAFGRPICVRFYR